MSNKIEFRGIKADCNANYNEYNKAILSVIKSGNFIEGEEVSKLERKLANYIGVKHCISVNSGTDALYLILRAMGIKSGDAVLLPTFTFFATAEVVVSLGAIPLFVDSDMRTFNISVEDLKKKIDTTKENNPNTKIKALIAVDLFGKPCKYDEIKKVLKRNSIKLIVDGAQSFGAKVDGKYTLAMGKASATSFFPTKPLACFGDGGAIFTDDDYMSELIRSLKCHGKGKSKYENLRFGVNSRLDTIQAAVLLNKYKRFDANMRKLNVIAKYYNNELCKEFTTPVIVSGERCVWAQYTVLCKSLEHRNTIINICKRNNIPVNTYYPKPLHMLPAFAESCYKYGDFPVAEVISNLVLSLPIHPYLTKKQAKFICDTITKY